MKEKIVDGLLICALALPTFFACGDSQKKGAREAAARVKPVLALELPRIPVPVAEPEDRAGFIAVHFWDNLDFTDRAKSLNADFMEQNFVRFLSLLPSVPEADRPAAFGNLIRQASATPETRALVIALGNKYLHHPSSPMKDDEMYADFIKAGAEAVSLRQIRNEGR